MTPTRMPLHHLSGILVLLLLAGAVAVPVAAETTVLPDYNFIFVSVANDAGAKYDAFGNDTYNIRFEGIDRGLNALHISTDPAVNFGQVTETDRLTGTFYATDSGGKGYEDEIFLMVAVNGTVPDDFSLRITADGYTWTPNPERNRPPDLTTVTYQPVSLDETFTKADFIYGPQTWKPTGNEADYPIYYGQDLSDTTNTFQLMFVDLNAGVLRPNTALENQGAVRITYSFENLESLAAFNVYGYCRNSNNGDDMVAWTNALVEPKALSGYSVLGTAPPVASFEAEVTTGPAPFTARFTDLSTNAPASWAWDFGDGDSTNATVQNPVHTYVSAGTYTVKLTATNAGGSHEKTKMDYITVTPSVLPLPGCTDPPTDPDDDGIYEDLNGNGRMDFADVVLYFNQMTWIGANEPVAAFDLNANGRIDFADIVALFNEV